MRIDTDFADRFSLLQRVFVGPDHQPRQLIGFRQHQKFGLMKLAGCDTVEDAEQLRGLEVQVPLAEAVPLGPGEYYVYQIEGLDVKTEDGEYLGRVHQVLFPGSNPVYVVRGTREVLIPALPEVLRKVDLEAGCLTVRLLPGLLD